MPALFAPSTRAVASRAKPEVWANQADFAAKAAAFAAASKALAAAAQADDKAAFTSALASTGASCKGCHDSYQVPPPPPPKVG
jgi:cytochrome c556